MNTKKANILIVDDDIDVLKSAELFLKMHFSNIHTESAPEKISDLMKEKQYDVVLLDMNFSPGATGGEEGFNWLQKILKIDQDSVVVLISAYGDVDMAVKAIKAGAFDFVLKPWQNEKLLATINAALKLRDSKLEVKKLRNKQKQLIDDLDKPFHNFIGESDQMKKVFKVINKVAKTDANVLILGENGTGKELVSRAIHRSSSRVNEVFISVDMGALSESLFESELFGHVKGAFTDARNDRPGRFELASGGTLFLDEIGNLPLPLQSKVLKALETREITRLGSNKPRKIDIRLICATNMPLHTMVRENKFRQDLLYRINTVEIHLPALRSRKDDIPPLTEHFLEIYRKKYHKADMEISESAIKKLMLYEWPGNVRELQHSIERAVIMSENPLLKAEDFFFTPMAEDSVGIRIDSYRLDSVEKMVIKTVLSRNRGNILKSAKELGITRAALYRRMEKHDL
jgi:DNA-binding NtrC family response regulator